MKKILKLLKIPIAYHHFVKPTSPPFITYFRISSNNFTADDKVYKKVNTYRIELYTKQKDIVTENLLENIFDENEIIYEIVSESYIDSEKIYQVIYEIQI